MRHPAVGVYRTLLVFYPRPFRREYGEDMTLMFAQQLRDESTWRVCFRAATDLALTVPTLHLESVMKTATSPFLSTFFAAVAVAALMFTIAIGTNPALAVVGGITVVVAGALAIATSRRNRPLVPEPQPGGWWKISAAGATILAALIVTVNVVGELPDGWWLPMIVTGLTSVVLIALGLIVGASQLASGSRQTPGA